MGVAWLALGVSHRQAMRARSVCEEALVQGFGADYLERILPAVGGAAA